MPCWVVPSVASEIWHVPVEQILQAVRGGQIPSKNENGFTFIDVAPNTPSIVAPSRSKPPAPIAYKVPRAYRFVEGLPKNNYGKILKTALRKELLEENENA